MGDKELCFSASLSIIPILNHVYMISIQTINGENTEITCFKSRFVLI